MDPGKEERAAAAAAANDAATDAGCPAIEGYAWPLTWWPMGWPMPPPPPEPKAALDGVRKKGSGEARSRSLARHRPFASHAFLSQLSRVSVSRQASSLTSNTSR